MRLAWGEFRWSLVKILSMLKEVVADGSESWFVKFIEVLMTACSLEMGEYVWKTESQSFTGIVGDSLEFHRQVYGVASKFGLLLSKEGCMTSIENGWCYDLCFGGQGCAGLEFGGKEDLKGRLWWCFWWWLWGMLRKSSVESEGRNLLLEEVLNKRRGLGCRSEVLKRGVLEIYHTEGKRSVLASQAIIRCFLISGLLKGKRSVLKQIDDEMERYVLMSTVTYIKRCVLRFIVFTKRSVLGSGFDLSLYLENASIYSIFSGFSLRFILATCERNFLCRKVFEMVDEVANLMNNLRFSEEELVEMESMENQCKEQYKPAGEEGPYQFGEWLRVPLAKKKNAVLGGRKQGIVYTAKGMGEKESSHGRGKNMGILYQTEGNGEGRGKQLQHAQLRPRGPKRVLQGKFEVCTPVGPKKARSASNSQGTEVEGGLEVVSPLKTSITVEAAMQPRREP
ncbi:hypothetical protein V6N12_000612 [Hibiscus sabdariffa]|uniref:Uncharacterized protein n=1 Tax=Hibiscus sabdariffa TaxID=183260 RepID=A0ABR2B959_9ROSI